MLWQMQEISYNIRKDWNWSMGGLHDCILDYRYFNKCYKLIAIDVSKQQINSTGNLTKGGGARIYLIIEEAKESFRFLKRNG